MKPDPDLAQMDISDFEAIIFDFDGTLAPNLDLVEMRRQVMAMSLDAGVPAEVTRELYIIEIIEASSDWLRTRNHSDADAFHDRAHQHITSFELEAAAGLEPFAEVRDILTALRARGIRSAVVTRNCEAAVRNTFPDIDEYLDLLLARDNVAFCKPDPRHLQDALDGLSASPSAAMMIGDGRLDMELGRSLELSCIGVLTGSQSKDALLDAGADVVVDHVRQLQQLL
jgi:phosphoglycolate phosphatase